MVGHQRKVMQIGGLGHPAVLFLLVLKQHIATGQIRAVEVVQQPAPLRVQRMQV